MVYINDKKFACESCIKGHRSSSCHHNDRPLFEIKKKGRPVSQCQTCRELRKSRRVHSKCMCDERKVGEGSNPDASETKSRRFIPIAPALPNGLKGALLIPTSWVPPNPRQTVESLLNPCSCGSVWSCHCRNSGDLNKPSHPVTSGLATLAEVATMNSQTLPVPPSKGISAVLDAGTRKRDHVPPPDTTPGNPQNQRKEELEHHADSFRGPELPPLLFVVEATHGTSSSPMPRFPTAISIPPMKSVASIAGTGCCCGFTCACPGCIEHRVPSQQSLPNHESGDASSSAYELKDCADGCEHCVDHQGGTEVPGAGVPCPSTTIPPQTIMEEFLARAASLPTPPRNRFVNLDPTNITTFPTDIFSKETRSGTAEHNKEQVRAAWGLVNIPKLDCCSGFCGCPDGNCKCGKSCGGCCAADENGDGGNQQKLSPRVPSVVLPANGDVDDTNDTTMGEAGPCCCGD